MPEQRDIIVLLLSMKGSYSEEQYSISILPAEGDGLQKIAFIESIIIYGPDISKIIIIILSCQLQLVDSFATILLLA